MFFRFYSLAQPALFCVATLVTFLVPLAAQGQALERMVRCDNNYYTNNLNDPKAINCKTVEGGNVTIVQGTRPGPIVNPAPGSPNPLVAAAPRASNAPQGTPQTAKVDNSEQRARDSEARVILESELRKAEARREELQTEFNSGEPEKRGDEARNYQKYLDRVSNLKLGISRIESDILGIRRELGRLVSSGEAALR